jgi:PKD repeat protein
MVATVFAVAVPMNASAVSYLDYRVSYWEFEGNFRDSVGSNHGTGYNGVECVEARYGKAGSFDGDNDYVQMSSSSLAINSDITILARIRLDTTSGYKMVLARYYQPQSASPYYLAVIGDEIRATFAKGWSDNYIYKDSTSANLDARKWYHIGATYELGSSDIQLYLDGNEISGSTTKSGTVNALNTAGIPTYIGTAYLKGGLDLYFGGLIDDVEIYDTALTADEVMERVQSANQRPIAEAGPDRSASVGTEVIFDGSGSYDPDGEIESYRWDFKDGTYGEGRVTTHTYNHAGTYNVVLIVTDDHGLRSWGDICNVDVTLNCWPVADAGPDQFGYVGIGVQFDGSGSYDLDGTIERYTWNFGDSSFGGGETTSHTYNNEGTYTVSLIVADNNGDTNTDTCIIEVVSAPIEYIIGAIENSVYSWGLPPEMENSYTSQLDNIEKSAKKGNANAGLGQLGAFRNHCEAKTGEPTSKSKPITYGQFDYTNWYMDLLEDSLRKLKEDSD